LPESAHCFRIVIDASTSVFGKLTHLDVFPCLNLPATVKRIDPKKIA
jgi:hypothetical protein